MKSLTSFIINFLVLCLFSISGGNLFAGSASLVKLDAYRPAFCNSKSDLQLEGSENHALAVSIKKFELVQNELVYTIQHRIQSCLRVNDIPTWVNILPPEGSAFMIEAFYLTKLNTNVHSYEEDAFGASFISQGQMSLEKALKNKELAKYNSGKTAKGELVLRVGYNVVFDKNGKLITSKDSLSDFRTGFFILKFQITPDRKVNFDLQ